MTTTNKIKCINISIFKDSLESKPVLYYPNGTITIIGNFDELRDFDNPNPSYHLINIDWSLKVLDEIPFDFIINEQRTKFLFKCISNTNDIQYFGKLIIIDSYNFKGTGELFRKNINNS